MCISKFPIQTILNPVHCMQFTSYISTENHIDVVCLMVFNATVNNISVVSWRSVLLVEETTKQPIENKEQVWGSNCN